MTETAKRLKLAIQLEDKQDRALDDELESRISSPRSRASFSKASFSIPFSPNNRRGSITSVTSQNGTPTVFELIFNYF